MHRKGVPRCGGRPLLIIVLLTVGYYLQLLSPLLNRLDERAKVRSDKADIVSGDCEKVKIW